MLLHRAALTNRSLYTQIILHADALSKAAFTCFYTQTHTHTAKTTEDGGRRRRRKVRRVASKEVEIRIVRCGKKNMHRNQ